MTKPTIKMEAIDPILASDYLETMDLNRPVNESRVKQYAATMTKGEWQMSPEPIIFNDKGELINGQHRLWAVIESGVTIHNAVARGFDASLMNYLDTGKNRSADDILALHGFQYSRLLPTFIRYINQWERHGNAHETPGSQRLQNYEILQRAIDEPQLTDILTIASRHYARMRFHGYSVSLIALGYYIFSQISAEDAEDFYHRLTTGLATEENDPIYQLRERIIKNHMGRADYSRNEMLALTIKAWNLYRTGKRTSRLIFQPGGANPEPFPVPV